MSQKPRATLRLMTDDSSSLPKLLPSRLLVASCVESMGRMRHHQNDSYPPDPPTGGAATRPLPLPNYPANHKQGNKKKRLPGLDSLKAPTKKEIRRKRCTEYTALNHPTLLPLLHHSSHHHRGVVEAQRAQVQAWPWAGRGTPAPRDREARPRSDFQSSSGEAPLRASGSTCESPCTKETKTCKTKGEQQACQASSAKRTLFSLLPYQMSVCVVSKSLG